MGKTYRGLTRIGNTIEAKSGTDRLQWKCDNMKSLKNEFSGYKGESLDVLDGLDTSQVETFDSMMASSSITHIPSWLMFDNALTAIYMCDSCKNLSGDIVLSLPKLTRADMMFNNRAGQSVTSVTLSNLENITSAYYLFGNGGMPNAEFITLNGLKNVTNMAYAFMYGDTINEAPKAIYINGDTSKVTSYSNAFNGRGKCETIQTIDLLSATNVTRMFLWCKNLKNLMVKNVKKSLEIGSSTSYGHLLTDESLINTAKELWDLTGATSQTLTLSTPSGRRFDAIYVKLITATDEMIAKDQYINNKKPCVVCESTDEGAMTLREYVVSKNWALA